MLLETVLGLATEKVGEALLSGVQARLNPQDVERFLRHGIATANEAQPQLWAPFAPDGRQGYGLFLNQFFRGRALNELQKPLEEGRGGPEVEFLALHN